MSIILKIEISSDTLTLSHQYFEPFDWFCSKVYHSLYTNVQCLSLLLKQIKVIKQC